MIGYLSLAKGWSAREHPGVDKRVALPPAHGLKRRRETALFFVLFRSFIVFPTLFDNSEMLLTPSIFLVSPDRFTIKGSPSCAFGRGVVISFDGEFDPGSERTLAAWIRHASRAIHRKVDSGKRVSNA